MTNAVPDGLDLLRGLAAAEPRLGERIESLLAGLDRLRPVSGPVSWNRVDSALVALRARGVVHEDEPLGPASALILSELAHVALDRALALPAPSRVEVAMDAAALAEALGGEFGPSPLMLYRIYEQSDPDEVEFRTRVAGLAALRGSETLLLALGEPLRADPERVLDFLEGSVQGWPLALPWPQALAAPPPGPVVFSRERRVMRARRAIEVVGSAYYALRALPRRYRRRIAAPGPASVSDSEVAWLAPARAVVSTGFSPAREAPGMSAQCTLARGRSYQFFVAVGPELADDAIDTSAPELPDLPAGAVLQVVLFGFQGELAPETGADVGELRLSGDGSATVVTQPGGVTPGQRRLYLTVTTPDRVGWNRMRCNIYCRQVLLQSRLIEVQVTDEEATLDRPALRSTVDFAVVSDLSSANMEAIEPRTLSVLINDDGLGTHGFRFFGGTEFKHEATLSGDVLGQVLDQARESLREASWKSKSEPSLATFKTLSYRYSSPTPEHLTEDLIKLARSGFAMWDVLIDQLAGSAVGDLRNRMRAPGLVEFANKESLDLLVPAACMYDHPLEAVAVDLTICDAFTSRRGDTPLSATACFQGQCPNYGKRKVVCPSGFWGFRHQIGYSASLTGGEESDARDQAMTIWCGTAPLFTVGASADPDLTLRDDHLAKLHTLAGAQWHFAWSRTDLLDLFSTTEPSIVYLYGHGGKQGRMAFFEVGSAADGPIVRSSLRDNADWHSTRPLVFLNGCQSAALAPDTAFGYASGFLQTAHASAVVGTEIAVFEKLATTFAEECLRRFVIDRKPLGQSVLETRLSLLHQGIPLGLAYLAFGPAELRLAT